MRFFYLLFCISLNAAPGIDYFKTTSAGQIVHVMEVDPFLYEIKPMKALDNGIGRESVLSVSERSGAIACINGGFFQIGLLTVLLELI